MATSHATGEHAIEGTRISLQWIVPQGVLLAISIVLLARGDQQLGLTALSLLLMAATAQTYLRVREQIEPRQQVALTVLTALLVAFLWLVWRSGPFEGRITWAVVVLGGVAAGALSLLVLPRQTKDNLTNEIGLALVTGVVLAGAAFVINMVLEDAFEARDRTLREAELKLAINRRDQLIFRGEDVAGFDLSRMNLGNDPPFDFSFADLRGAALDSAELAGIQLSDAMMHGASLRDANLTGANLAGAELPRATLRGANLTMANLREADLTGADLTNAILRAADLRSAMLEGADVSGADFTDAIVNKDDQPATVTIRADGEPARVKCPDHSTVEADSETPAVTFCDGRLTVPEESEPAADQTTPRFFVGAGLPVGAPIGRIAASDDDQDEVTYSLEDAGQPFGIDPATGVLRVRSPLAEGQTYTLGVVLTEVARVEEGDGDTLSEPVQTVLSVNVQVDADNHPPIGSIDYLVPADTSPGTKIGVIGSHGEYELLAGSDSFRIDEGEFFVEGPLEAGSVHEISVALKDSAGNVHEVIEFRVTVVRPNSAPVIKPVTDSINIDMGATPDEVVLSVVADDPDGDALTYIMERIDWHEDNCVTEREFSELAESDWPVAIKPDTSEIIVVRPPPESGCARVTIMVVDDVAVFKLARTRILLDYAGETASVTRTLHSCPTFAGRPC